MYFDSAEGFIISQERAVIEVEKHHASVADFFADMGEKLTYDAQEVLAWLGY
tara:strand:+ start:195 stop:350 length:156 start_codon:yes stop_codon:yes gene_type:complete